MNHARPLLEVRELRKHFPIRKGVLRRTVGWVRAVDGISFRLARGMTLGLVGESGCGKTTAGRALLRLVEPTGGAVIFDGMPVHELSRHRLRPLRRRMQMIFQDPYGSLDPRMSVGDIVAEPLAVHGVGSRAERRAMVRDLLERVGLSGAYLNHYPHEFSGGQRQRIGIARALALNPDLIVCDEPVSALDLSIQAQIINLLSDLQQERGMSYLFISHDLGVVEHVADEVAVMYMGIFVEVAPAGDLYGEPLHPYTQLLLAAIPAADPRRRAAGPVAAAEPPARARGVGCPFYPRCPVATGRCRLERPEMQQARPGHFVRCFQV